MPHLAELNIANAKYPLDHPGMKEFMDNLDTINTLAERSEGFIWRLQDESGDATGIQAFDDPQVIVNLSVWEDIDSLKHFVYKSHHLDFFIKRHAWFEPMQEAAVVLWWVPDGHQPGIDEAKERLQFLRKNGDTEYAFSFHKPFPKAD